MPEKRTDRKKTAAKKTVTPKKGPPAKQAATRQEAPQAGPPSGVCPRCGASKFAPEQRIRVDGNRTVRYSILVCERGHTFAKPAARFP